MPNLKKYINELLIDLGKIYMVGYVEPENFNLEKKKLS